MANDFNQWLADNGLSPAFTTAAGDSLYVNTQKDFGALAIPNTYGVQSFYLTDVIGFDTMDDEKQVAQWRSPDPWRTFPRSTSHSTKEIYIRLRLKNGTQLRIQVFRATYGNIERSTQQHADMIYYACQLSHIIFNLANKIPQGL